VVIENTGTSEGYGATAYADFDSATRKVTGIHVTSPGCNYTSAQAVIKYGKPWITNAVTLAAAPSGGLTKKGEGTLTLNAANTFTGPVAVEQGTLKIGQNGSLQDGLALSLASGGTLDLNGKSYACGSIAQHGGSVTNGTLTLPSSLTVDLAEAKSGNCITFQSGNFSFPANATLTLLNAELRDKADEAYTLLRIASEGTFANVPSLTNGGLEPWRLVLGNGGREVQLAIPRGTVLIFR
jgi:autotransporter-associated beta strand protein